jgi:hypothetical protein
MLTHRSLKGMPIDCEANQRVGLHLPSLAAVSVGEECEAPVIVASQQHDAHSGLTLRAHCCQGHGIGLRHLPQMGRQSGLVTDLGMTKKES